MMNKPTQFLGAKLIVYRPDPICRPYAIQILATFGQSKVFIFGMPPWFYRLARAARGLVPSFYARGVHDCDTGGRVHAWYPVAALNQWHLRSLDAKDWGDGPDTWQQISALSYIKWRVELWRKGCYCDRV